MYIFSFKSFAMLCRANIQLFPLGLAAFDTCNVIEGAAEPLYDLCDFVKQFHLHGVPVSTSRTDAPWVVELHCEVGAPVIRVIKYALTSAVPKTLKTCGALGRPLAGRVLECFEDVLWKINTRATTNKKTLIQEVAGHFSVWGELAWGMNNLKCPD